MALAVLIAEETTPSSLEPASGSSNQRVAHTARPWVDRDLMALQLLG